MHESDDPVYRALESLRNELRAGQEGLKAEFVAISEGNRRTHSAEISAVKEVTLKIEGHLEQLNSRTRRNEIAIGRLKLAVFGGTSLLLAILTLVVRFFAK